MHYCSDFSDKKIIVDFIKNTCRYHKTESQEYGGDKLAPRDFCPEAFYAAYPYCFSLLYGAKLGGKGNSVMVRCPQSENFIVMEVKSRNIFPRFLIRLKEIMIKFFNKIDFPMEYPHKKIIIRLAKNIGCPAGYKIGDEFEFNIRRRDELCPAGFNAIFPFLSSEEKIKIHCPDPRGVIYEKR